MEREIKKIISSGNGIWNEDALIISQNILGVIDGATPIHNMKYKCYNTLAEWMVQNFVEKFDYLYSQDNDYKSVCRNFIDYMEKDTYLEGLEDYDKPCFTSATVTFLSDKIKCEVLGDSYIYVRKKDGKVICITDKRVNLYAGRTVNATKNAKVNNDSVDKAIEKQKIENRKMMNVKGGYWVVAFKGAFEDEFIEEEFAIEDVDRILICTDGFQRLQQEFLLLDMVQILDGNISLNKALETLRDYENNNFLKKDYPCVKKSDDVAAILISVCGD